MAENSWWNGLLQTAKEKSASAVAMVRKDLSEFTSTMQNDTTTAASEIKSKLTHENAVVVTQKAKDGVSNLFGGLSKALTVEAEDLHQAKPKPSQHVFDRVKARLNAIQIDPETYCEPPTGSKVAYEEWLKSFDIEKKKGDISELLVANVEVRAFYTQLVPVQVSHADFWQRYFYKLHQLSLDEKRKADLMLRADKANEECSWDDDDDDDWGDLDGPASPPRNSGIDLAAKALSSTQQDTSNKDKDAENDKCSITSSDISDSEETTDAKEKNNTFSDTNNVSCDKTIEHDEDKNNTSSNDPKVEQEFSQTTVCIENLEIKDKLENKTFTLVEDSKMQQKESKNESIDSHSAPDNSLQNKDSDANFLNKTLPEESVPIKEDSVDDSKSVESKSEDFTQAGEEKHLKSRVKGDMIVIGSSSSSSSSSGNTPTSTVSNNSNKAEVEIEDEWEKEFEVTESDLIQHQISSIPKPITELPTETQTDEMEDDWESWD